MNKDTLIDFPCDFPIKIFGPNSENFVNEIYQIVFRHDPEFTIEKLAQKMSGKNNYLALTAAVRAQNQKMLDALYTELSTHPDVKMVL